MRKLADVFTHVVKGRSLAADDLRRNLVEVDHALLLMSLVHVTRDVSLLDRFGSALKFPEENNVAEMAGHVPRAVVPPSVLDEMVDIAVEALSRDEAGQEPT